MFVEPYLQDVRAARYRASAWLEYGRRLGALVRGSIWNNPEATRSVLTTGLGLFVLHVLWALGMAVLHPHEPAARYLLGAGFATLLVTLFCLTHLSLVRTLEGVPCSRLNLADWLTLLRASMAPGVLLYASMRRWDLLLGWIALAGATDVVDGFLARRLGVSTRLGQVLDPIVDIVFNVCMFAALQRGGLLPGWLMALVVIRYLGLAIGAFYIYITRGPVRIQPTAFGKASGVAIFAMLLVLVGVAAHGSPQLLARTSQVLQLALGFLAGGAIVHAMIMGWYNVKLTGRAVAPPSVVTDVPFQASRRRDL